MCISVKAEETKNIQVKVEDNPEIEVSESVTKGVKWEYADNYSAEADFTWMANEEPHRSRRNEILRKYPEIKKLYGHEWRTKYIVAATVTLQTVLAAHMVNTSWPLFLTVIYIVGATANHSLFLAIHEWSHNLGFQKPHHNQIASAFANLPIGLPYSASFKPYHMDHHRNQGVHGLDTDIAHPIEADIIQNRTFFKVMYMLTQLIFYALRPTIIKPLKPTKMMAFNLIVQLSYDAAMYYYFGINAVLYLLLSTVICGSFHPTAGHFLSEHLEVVKGFETYSYYGPLNYVTYNVGYHNEHHDFPFVPWSRLPVIKKMASEFYDPLPVCSSWVGIIWMYVSDPKLGAYSRVKRRKRVSAAERVNPNDDLADKTATMNEYELSPGKEEVESSKKDD
jgi:sphingolipid delta-4 desaturase